MMKNINRLLIVFALLISAGVFRASSQGFDVMPFAGFTFANHFDLRYGGTGTMGGGFTYGGMISKTLGKHMSIDFVYSRQLFDGAYHGTSDYNSGDWIPNDSDIPMACRYLQLGVTRSFRIGKSDKTQGFAGLNAGMVTFIPDRDYDKKKMLAPGIRTGIKVWPARRVGLMLQASLQAPFQRMGTTIYASNEGNSAGVPKLTYFPQFGITGGVIVKIAK